MTYPASAIYGPNAFVGVVNVITKKDEDSDISLTSGGCNINIVDMHLSKSIKDVSFNSTARLYTSDGFDLSDKSPYHNKQFLSDTSMWKPFKTTQYFGNLNLTEYNYYIDASLAIKGFSIGMMNWSYNAPMGYIYPIDRELPGSRVHNTENLYYARYETRIKKFTSSTSFNYRLSNIPLIFDIERNAEENLILYYYCHTSNRSFSFFQDFSKELSDRLNINFGIKYERRELQKGYVKSKGPEVKGDSAMVYDIQSIPIPENNSFTANSHFLMEDRGIYAQLKYSPLQKIDIFTGLRYDYNNIYNEVVTPRLGVIYKPFEGISSKLFYGTAYLEPTARSLYGGWAAYPSNPNLKPEKMQTFEASIAITRKIFTSGLVFYHNIGKDVIVKDKNIGKRKMTGCELYTRILLRQPFNWLKRFSADLYISYIDSKEDIDDEGNFVETGNMAPFKAHLILTGYLFRNLVVSLQNRMIYNINTVETNPVKHIDGYFVSDANIMWNNLLVKDLSGGLKIYNLFNANYYHPGYRDANAGENAFDTNGNYMPSKGMHTSRLPQPDRYFMVNLKYRF